MHPVDPVEQVGGGSVLESGRRRSAWADLQREAEIERGDLAVSGVGVGVPMGFDPVMVLLPAVSVQ